MVTLKIIKIIFILDLIWVIGYYNKCEKDYIWQEECLVTDRTLIDPEKFAAGFADASASPTDTQEDVVKAAKKYLLNYLTALYLVKDFNAVEKKNFNSTTETHFEDMTFPELMKRVQQMNKY